MKKFDKNILKELKLSFGRFIAIMAIIALGVGFMIGIMQATPDMKQSMSNYYDESNAYDIDVKGTYGLTQQDIDSLRGLSSVESVTPVVSTDVVVTLNEKESVLRMVGLPLREGGYLNQLELLEGRMPQQSSEEGTAEVVAVCSSTYFEKIALDSYIELPEEPDESQATYGDVYQVKRFKVVGIVSSPDYFYDEGREVSSLGTGVLSGVIFFESDDVYSLEKSALFGTLSNEMLLGEDAEEIVCTDCYVKISGSGDYEKFTDEYKNFILDAADQLTALGEARSAILNEAVQKLAAMSGQELADASWYVLDRASTNVSYISYDLNVEKVEEIAGIFPVFFIVVAALVALTSMTRMVEEERMQIGTFKALGYGNARIISKYLVYCCLASIIGCIVGILFGFSLLPSVFWKAYATMYRLPALVLAFSPVFAGVVFAIALGGTALVTWAACRSSLREKPSQLMQPKAPKPGKRVFLERIGFFWNHLKFKWKATIRNIFRYKKNMVLTIISVMGCTALILTGFGLNDSLLTVTDKEFGEILQYDALIKYTGDLESVGDESALRAFIGSKDGEGEKYLTLFSESGHLVIGNTSENRAVESVDMLLVENQEQFNSFVSLRERKTSAIIDIDHESESAIVVSENVATVYGIKVGDVIQYRNSSGKSVGVTVGAICENYAGSYVYMARDAYLQTFGLQEQDIADNTLLVKSDIRGQDADAQTKKILDENVNSAVEVTSISFVYQTAESYEGLESTMGLVIAILVISAGALAAIVLYNLTNINIDERRREIATLRVLGYRKSETAGYIYRESAILTVAGTLLGLGLGYFLHKFIVGRVNSVAMMFGKTIAGWSYLWAFLLTLAFAAIVYAFMLIKLNRINMAESLKSNE